MASTRSRNSDLVALFAHACVAFFLLAPASKAQTSPDYLPFDAARIGLPALTELGKDSLIEQHRQLIEEARRNIQEIKDLGPADADERIARYEQLILEELKQIARLAALHIQEATIIAAAGNIHDLPTLQRHITTVLSASRHNALSGDEAEALEQWRGVVNALGVYSSSFASACYDQEFEPVLALGLARQNQLLGTGIDVSHCAYRRLVATVAHTRVTYDWESCTLLGVGDWKLTLSGFLSGEGRAELGTDRNGHGDGIVELRTRVEGPTIRGRYTGLTDNWTLAVELSLHAPTEAARSAEVGNLRMEAIRVIGDGYVGTEWVEAPLRFEDRLKPCRER